MSPRDARAYRRAEQLAMVFGVATLILLCLDIVMWVRGSLKIPLGRLLLLEAPFPAGFALCTWLYRRIARRHGLL